MDQPPPISNHPLADRQGGKPPPDAQSSSGLDLVQVSKPDQAKVGQPVPTMGQFLAAIGKTTETALHANFSIALNQHYFNDNLVLQSLEAKNTSYTTSTQADGARTLSNISGLSLDLDAFGINEKLAVKSISVSKDKSGNTAFALQIENPMPAAGQKIVNASATLPLTFLMNAGGKISQPTDSQLLYSLSCQSSTTLPGMVLSDTFKDAGSVAQFIEKNPAWVNNILAPFMSKFGNYLKNNLDASAIIQGAAVDATAKRVGRIATHGQENAPNDANAFKIKSAGDYHETMIIDGRERNYTVHVPPSYDPAKAMPLVVLAHGLAQKGNDLEALTDSNKLADKEGFIAVYPNSVDWFNVKDLRTWDTGNGLVLPGQHAGDIQFMANIIDTAKKQLNVDPMRVYMTGLSNGGMLAYAAASALSGTLAGVAVFSSAMSGKEPRPKEPLSLINVHGTADKIIPYKGLTDTPPILTDVGVPVFQAAQYGTDYYKKLDGITEPYSIAHAGNQTIETASNATNGTAVEQITIAGVGHILDNRAQLLQQAWDFLKAHPRQTPPNPKDNDVQDPDTPVENLTTVRQLEADVKKRGTIGIEQDIDNVFDAARTLADNSVSPSAVFDKLTKSTHVNFNDPVSQFIENTTSISKKQDEISIDRKTDAIIPVNLGFGVGALKSIQVSKVSFDLAKLNGYPQLKNISGITLHAQLAGFNLASNIEDITELPDGKNGAYGRIYRATMQNPLPGWMRTVLMSPDQFNVNLKFDANMTPLIVNQNKTERQLLGKNPWVNGIADEAQDVINLTNRLNLGNVIRLGSDAGITAGLTYIGMSLGGSRAKLVGALCFAAAPMAIDFVRKELAT